jgi:hypothetical protein
MICKKGKYLKTSTMVTVIFMQSVIEIALPVKKLSFKNWSNLSGNTTIITYCLYVIKLKTLWKFVEAWFIFFLFKRYAY